MYVCIYAYIYTHKKEVPKIKYQGHPFNTIKNYRLTPPCRWLFRLVFMLHICRFGCYLAFACAKTTPSSSSGQHYQELASCVLCSFLNAYSSNQNMLKVVRKGKFTLN